MKRPSFWILNALGVIFLSCLLVFFKKLPTMKNSHGSIDYVFVPGQPFSLAVEDSDYTQNQVILDPLVGTLVKYGPSGAPEPYLAQSWSVSRDGKEYIFKIRKGLSCADGYKLTATHFAESLLNRLRTYNSPQGALELSKLAGWKMLSGHSPPEEIGIVPDDQDSTITMKFAVRPHDLMNILRMPYFGFYSPANFGPDGRSIDKHKIISCGPFELVSASESDVVIKKRSDWFTDSKITRIHFSRRPDLPVGSPKHPTIIDSLRVASMSRFGGYTRVFGTPVILIAMILNSHHGLFENEKYRQWFSERMAQYRTDMAHGLDSLSPASSLTEYTPPRIQISNDILKHLPSANKITAYVTPSLPAEFRDRIKGAIESTLSQLNIAVDYPKIDVNNRSRSGEPTFQTVDIRVSGVSIGNYFHSSAYRMMFCSSMGVSFPDVTGRICKLIDQYDRDKNHDVDAYGKKIMDQVAMDAAVIPLARLRLGWLYSNDFDPASIMPLPNYPRFELLKFK